MLSWTVYFLLLNKLSHQIIGAAIEVHSALGPGLLESVYRTCMIHDLQALGMSVAVDPASQVLQHSVSDLTKTASTHLSAPAQRHKDTESCLVTKYFLFLCVSASLC